MPPRFNGAKIISVAHNSSKTKPIDNHSPKPPNSHLAESPSETVSTPNCRKLRQAQLAAHHNSPKHVSAPATNTVANRSAHARAVARITPLASPFPHPHVTHHPDPTARIQSEPSPKSTPKHPQEPVSAQPGSPRTITPPCIYEPDTIPHPHPITPPARDTCATPSQRNHKPCIHPLFFAVCAASVHHSLPSRPSDRSIRLSPPLACLPSAPLMKRARRAASGCARETPHVCARPDACASVGEILRAGGGACVRRLRARGRCGGGKRLAHAVHVVAEGEKERKGGCVDVKPVRGSGCGGVEVVDLVSDDECESRCVRGDSHVRRVRDAAGEERADGGGAGCAGGASGVCGGSARVCGGYAAEKCLGVAEGNLRGAERPAHADEIQHCDGAVAHGMPHAKCQRARGRAQAQAAVHDSPTSTSDRDPAQASLAARAGGELRVAGRDDCGRMGTAREDLCARRADLDAIVAVRVRPLVTGAEGMRVRRGANGAHRSLARFDRKRFGGCGDDVREEEEDVGEKDVEEEEDAAVQEVPHVAREEASHPDTSTLQASHPQQQTVAHRDPVGTPERRQSNSTSTGDAHVQMPVEQIVPVNSIHPVEQPRQESISSVNSGIPLGQPFIEQTASVNNVNCGILAQVKLQQTLEQCHAAELPADNAGANEQVAPISSGNAHAYPPVEQSAPAISGHLLEQPHVEHISSVNSAHVPVPPQVEQHSQMPCAQLAAQPFVAQILSPSFDHMTVPSPAMPVSPINALQHHPQTPYEQAMLNHAHLPAHAAQAPEQKPSYISGVPSHQSTYAMSPALTSPNTHTPPSQTAPPILDASHQLFMLDQYKTAASIPVEPCIPTLAPMQNYPTPQSTYLQGGPRMYGGIPAEHAQPRPIGMRVPAPRNAEPPLKRVRRVWSPEEDRLLCELVFMQNRSVSEIVTVMKHRTGSAISQRLAMLKTAMRQDLSEFRERYRERNRECETEKDIAFQVQFGSGVDVPHDVTGGVVRGCDGEEKAKMDDPFVMQF